MAMDPSIYMQMAQMAANTSANMMRDWSGVIDNKQWLMNNFPNFWGSPYAGGIQQQSNAPMVNSIAQTMQASRQFDQQSKQDDMRNKFQEWLMKNNNVGVSAGGTGSYSKLWE
jgi:hypothetical protein